jgi:HK97 family phage prohead protease
MKYQREGQMQREYEIRLTDLQDLELRIGGDNGNTLTGYAVVYNSLSADLGGFKERVMPGSFKGVLAGNQDIRALVDHDSTKLLGRTSNGTLKLAEDAKGLKVEVSMPDTTYANDLKTLVNRKDIRGMSFGFRIPDGGQRFTKENGETIRELTNIDLKEVTVTSIPAYNATSVQIRIDPNINNIIRNIENPRPLIKEAHKKFRHVLARG